MVEVILTHTGKLGDMLYSLMIGSWLYKRFDRKIHWVLPKSFGPFRYISNLLLAQEQTSAISLVDHKIENFSLGGQPYRFDPNTFGISGEYYNLGFRRAPDKFIPEFYAEEYRLHYDSNFKLEICGAFRNNDLMSPILRSSELAMQMLMPNIEAIPNSVDLLFLAKTLAACKEFHSWYCGIAVLCWMANIPAHVYRVQGHPPNELYFPEPRNLTFHELTIHPKDMVQ
jgi:hypothetical protein